MTLHNEEQPILAIRNLTLTMPGDDGPLVLIDNVNLDVRRGETLGLVGESGSGKSMTALSLMGFVGRRRGERIDGTIDFKGEQLVGLSSRRYRAIRGNDMAMVFQEPMTSLDPAFTIGNQIAEGVMIHQGVNKKQAMRRVIEVLDLVRIPHPARRVDSYPHEFSGGMRQRVLIAMALVNNPDLIIADEPTTALDVSIQAQILELLRDLQRDLGLSMLFITHNMGVVADICDRVAVMYAGHVVEQGDTRSLFAQPMHPYTERLLAAMPRIDTRSALEWIPGSPPDPAHRPTGCRFAPRCAHAARQCEKPQTLRSHGDRLSRCGRIEELSLGRNS